MDGRNHGGRASSRFRRGERLERGQDAQGRSRVETCAACRRRQRTPARAGVASSQSKQSLTRCRFICNQDRWLRDQFSRDTDATTLAATNSALARVFRTSDASIGDVNETKLRQDGKDALAAMKAFISASNRENGERKERFTA
jgi:hypothetical protein